MMENPLKALREILDLTQQELAASAQVTRQVVVLNEQGLYARPSPKLLGELSRRSLRRGYFQDLVTPPDEITVESILFANYMTWVNDKRASNRHLFCRVDLSLSKPGHRFSTLKNQVAGTNNLQFCRALVYQPSLVREFEKKRSGSQSLFSALREVGVSDYDRELLSDDLGI